MEGVKRFGLNISIIINSVLLTIVYLVGVGVTCAFAKVANKHFLDTRRSKSARTYWVNLDLKKKPIEEYYRQF